MHSDTKNILYSIKYESTEWMKVSLVATIIIVHGGPVNKEAEIYLVNQ